MHIMNGYDQVKRAVKQCLQHGSATEIYSMLGTSKWPLIFIKPRTGISSLNCQLKGNFKTNKQKTGGVEEVAFWLENRPLSRSVFNFYRGGMAVANSLSHPYWPLFYTFASSRLDYSTVCTLCKGALNDCWRASVTSWWKLVNDSWCYQLHPRYQLVR